MRRNFWVKRMWSWLDRFFIIYCVFILVTLEKIVKKWWKNSGLSYKKTISTFLLCFLCQKINWSICSYLQTVTCVLNYTITISKNLNKKKFLIKDFILTQFTSWCKKLQVFLFQIISYKLILKEYFIPQSLWALLEKL